MYLTFIITELCPLIITEMLFFGVISNPDYLINLQCYI